MANTMNGPRRSKRAYMAAVVLGTALSTLGPAAPAGAVQTAEASAQAIADINRYCTTCWRNARLPVTSWSDCTQEVFRRLLERLPDGWQQVLQGDGEERREFLRAIDAVKKRTQRARKHSPVLDGVADRREPESRRLAEERDLVRQTSQELLTPRQQQILQLSFEGWSVHEVAAEMRLPAERVSDEKYKAIRRLRAHLAEKGEAPQAVPSCLPA